MAGGTDVGGETVNRLVRTMADLNDVFEEFRRREILIKDLDRGLLDFPSIIGGREVFLCWDRDEEQVECRHELDAGFARREKL